MFRHLVHIPDLEELTFNRTNNYFDNVRFRILKWMVFGNYFHPEFLIQQIPEGYMVTGRLIEAIALFACLILIIAISFFQSLL